MSGPVSSVTPVQHIRLLLLIVVEEAAQEMTEEKAEEKAIGIIYADQSRDHRESIGIIYAIIVEIIESLQE